MSLSIGTTGYYRICPAGDFEDMGDDSGFHINVVANDASGNGVPNIPVTDYWLDACDGAQALYLCAGAVTADSMTNENGETTISDAVSGGGCITSGGVYVAIQNNQVLEAPGCTDPICLDMEIKSPDLDTNGSVTLSDYGVFGAAYGSSDGDANWNECCDFNWDGSISLTDFGYFGGHYQHVCQ
ncbi:MAG: hypothetical protein U5O15_00940 [Candidatus Krumholzibacteriota bacterium]|nr:hypothetical protein [Candidatus Krumholzibacteriota bacterium]